MNWMVKLAISSAMSLAIGAAIHLVTGHDFWWFTFWAAVGAFGADGWRAWRVRRQRKQTQRLILEWLTESEQRREAWKRREGDGIRPVKQRF